MKTIDCNQHTSIDMLTVRAASVCALPGCRQPATHTMFVDRRGVAAVCSERCGYELIGPKRGADAAAADDDDDGNSTATGDGKRLSKADEVMNELRYTRLSTAADIVRDLATLRARVYDLTELQVSTATMPIGRHLNPNGSTMANRIETAIALARTTMHQIIDRQSYNIDAIRNLLQQLRDDIAADGALDQYDATPAGAAALAAGVPDVERQAAANRAFGIQKVAQFLVSEGDWSNRYFFEIYSKYIQISNNVYRADGRIADLKGWGEFMIRGFEERKNAIISGFDAFVGYWTMQPAAHPGIYVTNYRGHTEFVNPGDLFVARGGHAALFRLSSGTITYSRYANNAFVPVTTFSTGYPLYNQITIDTNGNVWMINDDTSVTVYDVSGAKMATSGANFVKRLASSAIGGVWAITHQNTCVKLQLVTSVASQDQMAIGRCVQIGPEQSEPVVFDVVRRKTDKERFTDMATMATTVNELITVTREYDNSDRRMLAGATLTIGYRIGTDVSAMIERLEAAISTAATTIDNIAENKPYDMDAVARVLSKLRDDIAADGVMHAFNDITDGKLSKDFGIDADTLQLIAYRYMHTETIAILQVRFKPTSLNVTQYGYISNNGVNYQIGRKSTADREYHIDTIRYFDSNLPKTAKMGPLTDWNYNAGKGQYEPKNIDISARSGIKWNNRALFFSTGSYLVAIFLDFLDSENILNSSIIPRVQSVVLRAWKANKEAKDYVKIGGATLQYESYIFSRNHMAVDKDGHIWMILEDASGNTSVAIYNLDGKKIDSFTQNECNSICAGMDGVWIGMTSGDKYYVSNQRLAPVSAYYAGMQELAPQPSP